MTKTSKILALLSLLAVAACGGGNQGAPATDASVPMEIPAGEAVASEEAPAEPADLHPFPLVSVPLVYDGDAEAETGYVLEHYWDSFFAADGSTTPVSILGVRDAEFEQALANYIGILQSQKMQATPDNQVPLERARKSVRTMFDKLERKAKSEPDSHSYLRITEIVSKYLYDPNSPMRDEDIYLPFAEAAAKSPCTREDMRQAYQYEAGQCRINGYGQKVPDIKYCDPKGHKGSLYGVNADYTMLFFSNPGCNACKEIVNEVLSRGYTDRLINQGKLAIVNIYIDEEVSKWRDYVGNYPSSWINGYDYTFKLRDSGAFDIRAIPSLYLLDSQKRVLMKDAITENVLSYLDRI